MWKKTTLLLAMMMLLAGAATATDLDQDGLPDAWEVRQCHRMTGQDCSPRRQDLILVACLSPGMTHADVAPTLDRVKRFFADVPGHNLDGTSGIHVIVVWGNVLRPDRDGDKDYKHLFGRAMPEKWRGKGHGVLIGPGTGGGGQTARSSWSGVSNNWFTIVHEIGHQLGLNHEPTGSAGQSPLYTSLMNYDYNYQLGDDPEAVHFSQGRFALVPLDERWLSEVLPFPADQLGFLGRSPYHFSLRPVDVHRTEVDWNRNGVFGEHSVRADIGDGSGVSLQGYFKLGKTAGSPSLVTVGSRDLLVIFPDLRHPADYSGYVSAALSPRQPGRIAVRRYDGRHWTDEKVLADGAEGDPHAVLAASKLVLTFPVGTSYRIEMFDPSPPFRRLAGVAGDDAAVVGRKLPVLVATTQPEQLWLFLWNQSSHHITYREVDLPASTSAQLRLGPARLLRSGFSAGAPVESQFPIHLVFDPAQQRLALVTSEPQGEQQGRMKLHTLERSSRGGWYSAASRWTMGPSGYSRSRARPWILYVGGEDPGSSGSFRIDHKADTSQENSPARMTISYTIGDTSSWDGWRTNLVGDQWTKSRNAPSTALYLGDVALAMRRYGGDDENKLMVFLHASGVQSHLVADHNDVAFIRTIGLRRSLGH